MSVYTRRALAVWCVSFIACMHRLYFECHQESIEGSTIKILQFVGLRDNILEFVFHRFGFPGNMRINTKFCFSGK